MSAEELRERADMLLSAIPLVPPSHRGSLTAAADYLRACADALDAGPVAWRFKPMLGSPWSLSDDGYYISCKRDQGYINEALYPLAMPAPLRQPPPLTDEEVAALIDETEYLPTDHAVRYLVETGECRVKEANEYPFHCDDIRTLLDRLKAAEGRAEYWKASHLAGNTEIERLRESLRGLLAVTSSKAPGTGLIVGAEDRHAAAIKQARAALENKHDR